MIRNEIKVKSENEIRYLRMMLSCRNNHHIYLILENKLTLFIYVFLNLLF